MVCFRARRVYYHFYRVPMRRGFGRCMGTQSMQRCDRPHHQRRMYVSFSFEATDLTSILQLLQVSDFLPSRTHPPQ
jgi:hypothetical protein